MPADLTPAERAVADILGRFLRTAPAEMQARNIIEAVRPHLYLEAADQVDVLLAASDDPAGALVRLDRWLRGHRVAELDGRGDDH